MSKFERVLSDEYLDEVVANSPFTVGQSITRSKDFILRVEQAVLAKLATKQEPVVYLYAGDLYSDDGDINDHIREHGMPLYTHPCVAPMSNKADCVSEKAENATQTNRQASFDSSLARSGQLDRALVKSLALQSGFKPKDDGELREYVYEFAEKLLGSYQGLADDSNHDIGSKEQHRTAKSHIPGAGKMIPPYGYRLIKLADIDTAIQRASVFDDGGDGADPESARSCIEILKGMISSKAADSLEPKKEVVHDRHTGKELLYIPPAGESLYSIAQARKESFSPALSVDIKEVQALLQSYLDSLDGWQLVPKEPSRDMLKKMFYEIFDMDGIEEEHLAARYRNMLSSFPKYTEVKQ